MASELKVNKITPESGVTLTLGDSGDTINFGSGVLPNFENLTVTGDLTVDTNSLKVDSTNNRVGIGTASPTVALDVVGGASFTDNVSLGDNDRLRFGDSQDLQIYHDGSNSYIKDAGTGSLNIQGESNVVLGTPSGEIMVNGQANGQVQLRYDNVTKLATTSTGIDVTGTVTSDGLTVDTDATGITIADASEAENRLEIGVSGGSSGYLKTSISTGSLDLQGGNVFLKNTSGTNLLRADGTTGDISFYEDTGTTPKFFWDASTERLGIGTSSPVRPLHIATADCRIRLTDTDDGTISLELQNLNGDGFLITNGASNLRFLTDNTERMRIDSSGDVGIGTSSPYFKLSLNGGMRIENLSSSPNTGSGTEYGYNTIVNEGFQITRTKGVGTSTYRPFIHRAENIQFETGTSSSTERMRIDSSGRVGIGTSSPSVELSIAGADPQLVLWEGADGASSSKVQLGTGTVQGFINLHKGNGTRTVQLNSDGNTYFTGGNVSIGTSSPAYKLDVRENRTDFMAFFDNDGGTDTRRGIVIRCGHDSGSGTNEPIRFQDGNGTTVGSITFTGGTVTYGSFTAHHPCFLPEGVTEYPYGTLLEIVSIFNREQNGVTYERGIRYNVQKTQSENSKSVLGAYSGPMATEEEPDAHQVYILGDGHILCNNSGGNISIGDGICSSSTAGIGKKATDNPSMIIGIAQENVTFENDTETKLVAVQYGLQQFIPWGN